MKLLIIEDNLELREVLTQYLEKERYIVESAADYSTARQKIFDYEYDCILLDITLPDGNGLNLLKEARERGIYLKTIILSAKDSVEDKVLGLQLGADDYLPKPFHLSELLARIESLIRRTQWNGNSYLQIANLTIDTAGFSLFVDGTAIDLGRKEYDILLFLIRRQGHIVEKSVLAEAVWGDHIDQADSMDFIYAHIKNLRKKLSQANAKVEIKTVYGFGYKLIAE
ncbi:MAG: response regulator transcription factor [Bacteroidales bacterium]|nr:response regulator transcription factor [Bacteroidales bacterium]